MCIVLLLLLLLVVVVIVNRYNIIIIIIISELSVKSYTFGAHRGGELDCLMTSSGGCPKILINILHPSLIITQIQVGFQVNRSFY